MKNLLFLGLLVVTLMSSCKKEVIYPSDQLPQTIPTGTDTTNVVNPWGKFLVTEAIMYVDDKQTGQHFTYNHFSSTKDTSSLRWGGPLFDIEVIIKNVTTYSFWKPTPSGLGKFELNSDTTKFIVYSILVSINQLLKTLIMVNKTWVGQQDLIVVKQ